MSYSPYKSRRNKAIHAKCAAMRAAKARKRQEQAQPRLSPWQTPQPGRKRSRLNSLRSLSHG